MRLIPAAPGVKFPDEFPMLKSTWRAAVIGLYVCFLVVPAIVSGIYVTLAVAAVQPGYVGWLLLGIVVMEAPVIATIVWLRAGGYASPHSWTFIAFFGAGWQLVSGAITVGCVAGPGQDGGLNSNYVPVAVILSGFAIALSSISARTLLACPEIGATNITIKLGSTIHFKRARPDSRDPTMGVVWLMQDRIQMRCVFNSHGKRAASNLTPPQYFYFWFSDLTGVRSGVADPTIVSTWFVSPDRSFRWESYGGEYVALQLRAGGEASLQVDKAQRAAYWIQQRISRWSAEQV